MGRGGGVKDLVQQHPRGKARAGPKKCTCLSVICLSSNPRLTQWKRPVESLAERRTHDHSCACLGRALLDFWLESDEGQSPALHQLHSLSGPVFSSLT